MKTETTSAEIQTIIAALDKICVRPFGRESGDPKYDAQRNLSGKTHYVDYDTLRFHKSRVLSSASLHGGLLFRIICSDALDANNTKRGFRAVVFDVFGTTLDRPKLEEAAKTSQAAPVMFWPMAGLWPLHIALLTFHRPVARLGSPLGRNRLRT